MGSGRRLKPTPGDESPSEVTAYEASLHPELRRRLGAHYTPRGLARFLVARSFRVVDSIPLRVCDPTCGGGAFLLEAAEELAERGVDPVEVVQSRLFGADVDGEALDLARRVLLKWVEERCGRELGDLDVPGLIQADLVQGAPAEWTDLRFDLILGNPPFLSQTRSATSRSRDVAGTVREAFPELGAYADSAALILLVSTGMLADAGVATMIQPQSFLSARDTLGVRDALLDRTDLVELWSSDEEYFDASVRVCAVTVRRRGAEVSRLGPTATDRPRTTMTIWSRGKSPDVATEETAQPTPRSGDAWGPVFAPAIGLPTIGASRGMKLGDIASATAGFRDEFYALVEACIEGVGGAFDREGPSNSNRQSPRLVTVGMIDPCRLTWGEKGRRLGGVERSAPILDLAQLSNASPAVYRWVQGRLVPKILVATQTKVIEAAVDPTGRYVPVTPVISVEPRDGWQEVLAESMESMRQVPGTRPDLWWIVAALSAPSVAARAAAEHLGTGLSGGALRISARSVLNFDLPTDGRQWAEGAVAARQVATGPVGARREALADLGSKMCLAYGEDQDGELFEWWFRRAAAACSGGDAQRV